LQQANREAVRPAGDDSNALPGLPHGADDAKR
jgi:hypothetical protein